MSVRPCDELTNLVLIRVLLLGAPLRFDVNAYRAQKRTWQYAPGRNHYGIIGDGCGDCPACHLRKRGLDDYLQDKTAVLASLDASEPNA